MEADVSTSQAKTILITGASSGIGKATCLYLADRGHNVIGTSRAMARLSELADEASERGLPITPVELDINTDASVDKVLPEVIRRHGPIDVLVNNAGYGLWGPVESLSLAQLKAQFEPNLFAAVRLIKAVLPGMVARRSGTIINVSSVLGRMGTPFNGAYAASKFALEGMSESLRAELSPFGVRVVVVEPGLFRTGFHSAQVSGAGSLSKDSVYAPYIDRYRARHARFERFAGDPVKVARVIHRIVRSRHPGFRYPVGLEARLGLLGARLLPERLFQALLSRAMMR